MMRLVLSAIVFFSSGAACLAAEDGRAPRQLTFERDIRPIFKAHCFHCHGEDGELQGGLDLRLRRLVATGGDSGPAIEPGHPESSVLLERVRAGEMPPGKRGRLSQQQVDVIEAWIASGASTARPEPAEVGRGRLITEEERAHWAFQPLARPETAKPQSRDRVRNEVDAFLLAQLEQVGLTFSLEADKPTLIRRATFDLHGLPPDPAEVACFVADEAPDAYERLIDRLLASPRYGERWGRHWLDVVGYADSEGYNDADEVRDNAWRYRDYVIRGFNSDKPFDAFIHEQLAGDELVALEAARAEQPRSPLSLEGRGAGGEGERPGTKTLAPPSPPLPPRGGQGELSADALEKLTATGFLRMVPDGTAGSEADLDSARHAVITETVKVVSSALLGMTVGCAECHDHRFDPILQRDFYRLRAIFEPALNPAGWRTPRERQISLMSESEQAVTERLEREAQAVEAELAPKLTEFQALVFEKELENVPEALREQARAAGLAWRESPKSLSAEQQSILQQHPHLQVSRDPAKLNLFLEVYDRREALRHTQEAAAGNQSSAEPPPKKQDELKQLRKAVDDRTKSIRAKKPVEESIRALTEIPGQIPVTYVFHRGDRTQPGDPVVPGDLTVLSGEPVDFPTRDPALPSTGRRLAFARRLTDGKHPLLARVLVNRFWLHHFGRGLVNTPGDFGTQGDRPTHPELLDWLAGEFVAGGWSLKALHRLVMSSAAYRQRAQRHEDGDRVDADNQLYWRMPVRRLEAETIRDAVLAVGGRLNLEMYGRPVPVSRNSQAQTIVGSGRPDDLQAFRRSVYVQVRRSLPVSTLAAFDAPQMEPNCEIRNCSTVAPQSLLLMNNEFIVQQSEAFAKRLVAECGTDPRAQIRRAWQLAFATEPSEATLASLLEYLADQADMQRRLTSANGGSGRAGDAAEFRALASLCQTLVASNGFLYTE